MPYKAVNAGDVDKWLAKHFGNPATMAPGAAAKAADLLDDVAPGVALGTRTHVFDLVEQLRARAGG